jgi:hypothetical protein
MVAERVEFAIYFLAPATGLRCRDAQRELSYTPLADDNCKFFKTPIDTRARRIYFLGVRYGLFSVPAPLFRTCERRGFLPSLLPTADTSLRGRREAL